MPFVSFDIHAVKSIGFESRRAVTESGNDVAWISMIIKGSHLGEEIEITAFHATADVAKFERLAAAAREIFAEPAPARETIEQTAAA